MDFFVSEPTLIYTDLVLYSFSQSSLFCVDIVTVQCYADNNRKKISNTTIKQWRTNTDFRQRDTIGV